MIYVLNATRRFDDYIEQIKEIIEDVLRRYGEIIKVGPIDIVVAENAAMTIPGQGMGGYASSAHELYVPIDLDFGDTKTVIETHMASTIAHELAHIVRLQAGIAMAPAGTLADNVVAEGIADHLSVSLYPNQDTPWTTGLSEDEFGSMKKKFLAESNEAEYDHNGWFYGSKEKGLPHWTGYTLGYALVKDYLQSTEKAAADILLVPTSDVIAVWK